MPLGALAAARRDGEQGEGGHEQHEAGYGRAAYPLGGAGRPDRAVTTGILVMARAGRDAATNVATTARASASPITGHGRLNTPITWWALVSSSGR